MGSGRSRKRYLQVSGFKKITESMAHLAHSDGKSGTLSRLAPLSAALVSQEGVAVKGSQDPEGRSALTPTFALSGSFTWSGIPSFYALDLHPFRWAPLHSYRNTFAGLVCAAFHVWRLVVASAMNKDSMPPKTKGDISRSTRYAKFCSQRSAA